MIVRLEIAFSFKRDLPEGYQRLELPAGCDVLGALQHMVERYPVLRGRLFAEEGQVRRDINALVNGSNVRLREGLATILHDADRLTILPPVGGG